MDVLRLWSTIGRNFSSPVAPRERASASRHSSLRVSACYGSAPKLRGTTPRATDSVASRCGRPARSTSQCRPDPSTRLAHSGMPAACRILTSCVLRCRRSRHSIRRAVLRPEAPSYPKAGASARHDPPPDGAALPARGSPDVRGRPCTESHACHPVIAGWLLSRRRSSAPFSCRAAPSLRCTHHGRTRLPLTPRSPCPSRSSLSPSLPVALPPEATYVPRPPIDFSSL